MTAATDRPDRTHRTEGAERRSVEVAEVALPIGRLALAAVDGRLVLASLDDGELDHRRVLAAQLAADATLVDAADPAGAVTALGRYLDGDLRALDAVDVDLTGSGTPFQRRVWTALRTIPAGTTWSYGQLAEAVGDRRASRAVGSANGANRVVVVVPCHRVVRADGSLGGYACGPDRKAWLLDHERRHAASG